MNKLKIIIITSILIIFSNNFAKVQENSVVISKSDYGNQYLPNTKYNHENTISVGIVYSAFFI
ncbi:MAG: hypothetical protein LBV69_02310 [Bacteroidales bacterium]|jgi:hypothetical protein|nr:hypothetical protein [Bacteroidales bacterium]